MLVLLINLHRWVKPPVIPLRNNGHEGYTVRDNGHEGYTVRDNGDEGYTVVRDNGDEGYTVVSRHAAA